MLAVDAIDAEVEGVEERLLAEPGQEALQQVLRMKRALMHLRRLVAPQREVLNRMARDEYAVIPKASRVYFRDVYDHLVRLHDIVEGMRDLASGALDTYLSVINNRMNEVMKTLTLITDPLHAARRVDGLLRHELLRPLAALCGMDRTDRIRRAVRTDARGAGPHVPVAAAETAHLNGVTRAAASGAAGAPSAADPQRAAIITKNRRAVIWLGCLVLLGAAWVVVSILLRTITGRSQIDGIIGVILGLYISSFPARHFVDLLIYWKTESVRFPTRTSLGWWIAGNAVVLLAGWLVIVFAAARFTAHPG